MKKKYSYLLLLTVILNFLSLDFINAQVGVGNNTPRGLLDVNDNQSGDASAGLVLPSTSNPYNLIDPITGVATIVEGTITYDKSEKCVRYYRNGDWSGCLSESTPSSPSATLNCEGTTGTTSYTIGTAASGNITVPYTNGNGAAYPQEIKTAGGLTFTRDAGTLSTSGNLTYKVTGTPTTAGNYSTTFTLGSNSCTFNFTVNGVTPSATLNCSSVTTPIIRSGDKVSFTVSIPYTNGNGQDYLSETLTYNGLTGVRSAGTLNNGSGILSYVFTGTAGTAGTGTLNVTMGSNSCSFNLIIYDSTNFSGGSKDYYGYRQNIDNDGRWRLITYSCIGTTLYTPSTLVIKSGVSLSPTHTYVLEVEGISKKVYSKSMTTDVLGSALPDGTQVILTSKPQVDNVSGGVLGSVLSFTINNEANANQGYCVINTQSEILKYHSYYTVFNGSNSTIGQTRKWTVKDQLGNLIAEGNFVNNGQPF